MQTMRSQFEENMTRLSQRKTTNNDRALHQRIAELEEALQLRDERGSTTESKKRSGRSNNTTSASPTTGHRSLTKKFRL